MLASQLAACMSQHQNSESLFHAQRNSPSSEEAMFTVTVFTVGSLSVWASAGSLLTLLPVSQLANDAEEAEAKLQAVHGFIMRFKTTNARPSEAGPPLAHKRTQKSKTAQKMRIYIRKTQLTQNITTTTTISTTANNKNDHTHSLIDSSISNYLSIYVLKCETV